MQLASYFPLKKRMYQEAPLLSCLNVPKRNEEKGRERDSVVSGERR